MEKRMLTRKYLLKYKYYGGKHNSESMLFYTDDEILKLLQKEFRTREHTILKLPSLENDSLALPKYSLYDRGGFLGYAMDYFKDYIEFESIINSDIPFDQRKQACLELYNLIEYLKSQYFAYYDLNPYNVLFKDGSIKLIDLDSGIFMPDRISDSFSDYTKYDTYLRFGNYTLAKLTLSILFDELYDTNLDKISSNRKELFSISSDRLIRLYKFVLNKPCTMLDVGECLDEITEDYTNEVKLILKK